MGDPVNTPTRLLAVMLILAAAFWGACGDDDTVGPTKSQVDPYSLGLTRTEWTIASTPYPLVDDNGYARGTIRWHNPPALMRDSVFLTGSTVGESVVYPLRLIFRPRGHEPQGPDDDPCFMLVDTRSWAGIMRLWAADITSMEGSSERYLQLRVKPTGGILHIDFGRINENVDGDDRADDEDTTSNHNGLDYDPDNGINEDTGLDGLLDEDETTKCQGGYDPITRPDPAGDNWWFEGYGSGAGNDNHPPVPQAIWSDQSYRDHVNDAWHRLHYEWINGTEGNIDDQLVQGQPDREDLAGDGIDLIDAYISFEISLTTDASNPYFVENSGLNGWYTYQIPLYGNQDAVTVKSHPALEVNWKYCTHVRVWFEQPQMGVDSLADMDSLWIADWRVVAGS